VHRDYDYDYDYDYVYVYVYVHVHVHVHDEQVASLAGGRPPPHQKKKPRSQAGLFDVL